METTFLYSNVRPLLVKKDQEIINDRFREEVRKSDQLDISVGFFSHDSLQELDRLVEQENIKNVCLILGMYYYLGFPKTLYEIAWKINERWQKEGIGEIRVSHALKYHGKLYCFYKNNQIHSAILGSPNLSFLAFNKNLRNNQYEIAWLSKNPKTLKNSLEHMNDLKSRDVSENISVFQKRESFSYRNNSVKEKKTFKISLDKV